MDKAYDAKFGLFCNGPSFFLIPRFFFKKAFFLFIFSVGSLFAKEKLFEEKDIPIVMEQLFNAHIENKKLNVKIVRRIFKLYIESFDFNKTYLLEKEIKPFLNIKANRAQKIVEKIKRRNFSDFYFLNEVFDRAVKRSRSSYSLIKKSLLENIDGIGDVEMEGYAKTKRDLLLKQKSNFLSFYNNQKKRSKIDSLEKKEKVFSLFMRKRSYKEGKYLLGNRDMHYFVLHFLKAFARSLDAHTYFFSESEAKEMRMSLEKQFEGIGVVLSETIDGVVIVDLIDKGPAYESKRIRKNDLIIEINHENVERLSFEEVLKKMKKKEKGKIVLGLKREGIEKVFKVTLKARAMDIAEDRLTFSYELFGDGIIGKLNLKSFYENSLSFSSEKDIKRAISSLKSKGKLKGIVLDLRENAGGFLSQAVKVAGLFISNGVVVISKYGEDEVRYLRSLDGKSCFNGPLIILTSKMSASAAEIVAQALQDYGIALVVGDKRTFGKGSIQYQTVTSENSDYYYKVTIGKYYTVSGKSTQINGVRSDIIVPSFYYPYQVGEKYLEYGIKSDRVEEAYLDSLEDLEPKVRRLFQINYLPTVQRVISYWVNMLPVLRRNSKYRLENDKNFKVYLEKQRRIKARLRGEKVGKEKGESFGIEDLQMNEAINIIKDMIIIEADSRRALNENFKKKAS